MKKIRFRIANKRWTMRLMRRRKYVTRHGDDSCAITYTEKRVIDVGPDGRDFETLTHELIHAYLAEFCVQSSDLDVDQMEEFCAELFAKRGREILDLAEDLLEEIKSPEMALCT